LFGYVISQCAGAVVVALVVCFVVGGTFAPAPAATASVAAALLVEVLYTFALALVVLHPVASPRRHGHSFYGLAIGFTIVVAAFAGGPISGGAFNPAVRFGPIVVATLLGGSLAHLWIHIVAALSGGALAAAALGLQEREAVKLHAEPSRTPESGPAA
jgi:aquaporin Z